MQKAKTARRAREREQPRMGWIGEREEGLSGDRDRVVVVARRAPLRPWMDRGRRQREERRKKGGGDETEEIERGEAGHVRSEKIGLAFIKLEWRRTKAAYPGAPFKQTLNKTRKKHVPCIIHIRLPLPSLVHVSCFVVGRSHRPTYALINLFIRIHAACMLFSLSLPVHTHPPPSIP